MIKIDYNKKRLVYTNTEGREHRLSYDILINSGPIDLLVEQTKICTPLQLKHNKVNNKKIERILLENTENNFQIGN